MQRNLRSEKKENVRKEDKKGNATSLKQLRVVKPSSHVYPSKALCHHMVSHLMWNSEKKKKKRRHENRQMHMRIVSHAYLDG